MEGNWFDIFTYVGIAYAILYTGSKVIFSIMSLLEIRIYFWKYDHIIEDHELQAHLKRNKREMPMISIISPAYNEGVLIVDTVSSFLHQSYQNKEVIICSDGGTDGTLEKLIEHFELVEVADTFVHSPHIQHKPIRRYFRSCNPQYAELLVIDKENGGKADAQNAGVAIAKGDIVTIVDADSILEKYALIHLADIFEREGRVIGVGTPIGVVNDCNVGPDGVEDASVPKSFWAKIQVIEYLRSFLLGRMFAQRYRGLQIVSGAFGVYKKWIIESVGGYSTGSLAEDMDIDGKIWRYIDHHKLKYRIRYIPEVFCWSEVPDTFRSLASQRDRWARGMTETIWKNRDLFFNPKFKMLGLFSYPYYVFFEWMTPFIELFGLLYFIIGASLGWFSFFILEYIFLTYWVIGIFLNICALSVEAITRGHYKNRITLVRLSIYAILEPLFYHWINSYLYVMGNLKMLLFRKKGWGKMERVGIKKTPYAQSGKAARVEAPEPVMVEQQSRPYNYRMLVSRAAIIMAVAVSYFILQSVPPGILNTLQDNSVSSPKNFNRSSTLSLPVADSVLLDSVRFNPPQPTQQNPEPEPIVDNLVSGEVQTIRSVTGNYYIIVASVINPEFAQVHAKELSEKGFHPKIIPSFGKRQFNLLAIDEAGTMAEARAKRDVLKPQYGEAIWIVKW
jgi:biofilm PGA synthesis N-glycosyltransferase PgaC